MKKIEFNGYKNIIGNQVRINRAKCKLSQGELAAKLQLLGVNMDQQMVSRIESNDRIVTDYELACFSRIFSVSPEELLRDFSPNLSEKE